MTDLSDAARLLASQRKRVAGGRPRSRKKRCECGAMTATRAKKRGHVCKPEESAKQT